MHIDPDERTLDRTVRPATTVTTRPIRRGALELLAAAVLTVAPRMHSYGARGAVRTSELGCAGLESSSLSPRPAPCCATSLRLDLRIHVAIDAAAVATWGPGLFMFESEWTASGRGSERMRPALATLIGAQRVPSPRGMGETLGNDILGGRRSHPCSHAEFFARGP